MAFNSIKVYSEKVIGEVQKSDNAKIVVRYIEASNGNWVEIKNWFIRKGNKNYEPGKGQWLPLEFAEEIGNLVLKASEVGNHE